MLPTKSEKIVEKWKIHYDIPTKSIEILERIVKNFMNFIASQKYKAVTWHNSNDIFWQLIYFFWEGFAD